MLGRTLVSEVCMYVANREAAAAGHGEYVTVRTEEERGKPHPNPRMRQNRPAPVTAESLHYDGKANRGLPKDLCGSVSFGGLNEEGARGISARGHRDAWAGVHDLIIMAAKDVGDHFVAGTAVTNQPLPDVSGLLDRYTVAASYSAVLELRMKEAGDKGREDLERKLGEDAAKAGWLAAASFVNTLALSAARLQSAATNLPRAALYSDEIGKASATAKSAVEAVVVNLAKGKGYAPVPLAVSGGISGLPSAAEGRERSLMDRVFNFVDPEFVIVVDSGNPLLDLANTGALLMNGALGAMGMLAGMSAGVNFFEGIPFVGKALDVFEATWPVVDGLVTPLIGILLIAGAVLLYVLPVIPFLRFLFGILSWLVAVIEGMLAVTVFCAAHVTRGDGNRLATEATRDGWLFLPALVLRPVLMLFGLVLGYYLFVVVIGLFNEVWVPRMQDAGGSEGLDLVDYVVMVALYVMVVYGMLNACFKMIDGLPNAVLAWIGGRGGAGGEADEVSGMATGGIGRAGALRMGFRGPGAARSARQGRAAGGD
ncbi:MAG: DotA/TraY family protein [Defluviicoccus sp.]|nr:DotA/TraY family protein [Defluviicoccus sp.]